MYIKYFWRKKFTFLLRNVKLYTALSLKNQYRHTELVSGSHIITREGKYASPSPNGEGWGGVQSKNTETYSIRSGRDAEINSA